jgi:UDP-N-acetylmuramoyl-L-alanyl-D-glutamate--2,6-diaminopimelate ligase
MAANAADYAVMEISSHSLRQNRVWGINFKTAVFTNISPEHLDYHKDMQDYKRSKALLFEGLSKDAIAVLNIDDEFGRQLAGGIPSRVLTYGMAEGADIQPQRFSFSVDGTRALINTPGGKVELDSRLVGKFNLYNMLSCIGAAAAEGVDPHHIADGIEAVKTVPGRVEEIAAGQPFKVYVDYAHTDDALKNILCTLNQLPHKRIITLFGCGGDRDTTKRPRMGRVASELSDIVVVTTDNPRSEDPKAIARQVVDGIEKNRLKRSFVVLDRQLAIKKAIGMAQEGDIVLLAGKGHETYQIFKNMVQPFDDRHVAKKALADLGHTSLCLR